MTTKNTEGLEHKQQGSAVFVCTDISIHLSIFTIISAKELIGFEGTIKCIFPAFSVKPNPPTRPCLTAMPLKLGSAKSWWRIRWIPHRNTKTVHSQSSVRGHALHTPFGGQNRFSQWTWGDWRRVDSAFPAFSRKSVWMGEGRNGQVMPVLLERSCTHYQKHFFHAS